MSLHWKAVRVSPMKCAVAESVLAMALVCPVPINWKIKNRPATKRIAHTIDFKMYETFLSNINGQGQTAQSLIFHRIPNGTELAISLQRKGYRLHSELFQHILSKPSLKLTNHLSQYRRFDSIYNVNETSFIG